MKFLFDFYTQTDLMILVLFFIVLTALSKNSKLIIKNVNINSSRRGVITILKKMGVNIFLKNIRIYKGEKNADIKIKSPKKLKAINLKYIF